MIKLIINEKKYNENVILKNTGIEINKGDFVCIKGESGIGKSTLLSMIGLLEDYDGKYEFNNNELTSKMKQKVRIENISYVFQKPYLMPRYTVKENVIMPLRNLKLYNDKQQNKIEELSELLNISSLLNRYPQNLSGGEAMRVSICRAICSQRNVILCDEPTGSLDPKNANIIMEMLKRINREFNRTIIVVSHFDTFDDMFDKIYKIEDKKIIGCLND